MLKRIITSLIIIAAVVPPFLFGGILLDALVALVLLVGGFEMFQLTPAYKWTSKWIYLCILVFCFCLLFVPFKLAFVSMGIGVMILLSLPVFFKQLNAQDAFMMSAIFLLFYTFASAFKSIYHVDALWIWFIAIATYACDTGAYMTGYFFGKHKLCKRISPKKTIEGSIGGIVFSYLLSFTFAFFFLKEYSLALIIIAGLFIPIVSQLGDLAFSAIKRSYDIKDFSTIFPGHGGFMDRIDSLVFSLVFFHMLMVWIG